MKRAVMVMLLGFACVACGDDSQGNTNDNENLNVRLCGNGVVDTGEVCDDGELNSDVAPDACRSTCREPWCGDGVMDTGEGCDDGNNVSGDGCSATCASDERCGNGVLDPGEACDEGAANAEDPDATCRTDCQAAGCGDGVVDTGEQCDDDNTANTDGCLSACAGTDDCCVPNRCGDGYVDETPVGGAWQVEACDDGVNDGTICRADCGQDFTVCGNGLLDQGEGCDAAGSNSDIAPDGCRSDCRAAHCGDGVQDSGEACDAGPGNGVSPEVCLGDCTRTECGDGYVGGAEECDDATANDDVAPDACRTNCREAGCGDGVIDQGEECDGEALGGQTCTGLGVGYTDGTLGCAACGYAEALCFTCGDGVCEPGETFVDCPAECGAVDVASGGSHSCAVIGGGGTVRCWGNNAWGQLGTGGHIPSDVPVTVPGLTDMVQVTAGGPAEAFNFTCATKSDGMGYCWGYNQNGQLGYGGTLEQSQPTQIAFLDTIVEIAAGRVHACARTKAGEVFCWGDNEFGQLGDGTNIHRFSPVQVLGITDAVSLASGGQHSCAISTSQGLLCWGAGTFGQLGDGNAVHSTTPVVALLSAAPGVVAAGLEHTCASVYLGLTNGYGVECFGRNDRGQLGLADTTNRPSPEAVSGPLRVQHLAAGTFVTCAARTGETWCWGSNDYGQLGDGTNITSYEPVAIGLSGIQGLTMGIGDWTNANGEHTCALLSDASVRCWGDGGAGQLGDGLSSDSNVPVTPFGF